jgi:HNH endonuclease
MATGGRAGGRCECYRLLQVGSRATFEIDHIIARHHHGPTASGNLALSCAHCNGYKGPNLTGRDPHIGKITTLFHPRKHKWGFHFRFDGGTLTGRTAIGRTTVDVLRINQPQRVALREILIAAGVF